MNSTLRIVILLLVTALVSGCLQFIGEWENEDILFINSQNQNEIIISQSLDLGATDSSPSTRYVILNIKSKAIAEIQLNDLDTKWIKLPKKIAIVPFKGHMFYPGELRTIENFGCDKFPHNNLEIFNDIILNKDQYQNVYPGGAGSKYYYSCQPSNDIYNSYVFRSGGGLILQTTNKDFEPISNLELMRKTVSNGVVYSKYSRIIDNADIELTDSISVSFPEKEGLNMESNITLIYKNSFTISSNGNIQNKSADGIGMIRIKTLPNI